MDAILASSMRLCQMVFDAGLQPGTEERLRMVLAAGAAQCLFNASFLRWFEKAVVGFLERLTVVTGTADELAARLAGLRGDELFRALRVLWLPATASEGVHPAQRLALQETVDGVGDSQAGSRLSFKIVYEGKSTASIYDATMEAFVRRRLTLDSIVEKHINLAAAAAAPRPSTTAPAN
ncbi:hypothetical protein D1007_60872 [Hordeum vulgare]|nr:hypothetical protein D1007_60872 [Hordeum vulgare]